MTFDLALLLLPITHFLASLIYPHRT